MSDGSNIVDMGTIAMRLGYAVRTVHSWRRRNTGFPDPAGRLAGRPYWNWEEVQQWAKETGRD